MSRMPPGIEYQEGALSIEPGKVTYWFNGKQKTSFIEYPF
jgi:hypothetical protein